MIFGNFGSFLIILGLQHKNIKWEDKSTKIIWQNAVLSQ